ncbi:PWWP domain-containing protein 2A [Dendropsophus ebraccatus]|uniref:PWWP domain-containing protein 2A n=1 Tax=Dendropsophus ebraccatus TaxID=150705 RepID=UPI0038313188
MEGREPMGSPCTTMEESSASPRVTTPDPDLILRGQETEEEITTLPTEEKVPLVSELEAVVANPETVMADPYILQAQESEDVMAPLPEEKHAAVVSDPEMVVSDPVMVMPDPEMVVSDPVMVIPDPMMVVSDPVMVIPDPMMVVSDPVMVIPDPMMVVSDPVMVMPDPMMVVSDPVMVMPDPEMVVSDPVMVMPDPEMVVSDPVMVMPDPEMVVSDPVMVMPDPEMVVSDPVMVMPDPEMVVSDPVMVMPDPETVVSDPVMVMPDPEMVVSDLVMVMPDPEMVVSDPVMVMPDPEMVVSDPVMVMPDPEMIVSDPVMVMPDPEMIVSDPVMVMPDPEMVVSDPVMVMPDPVMIMPDSEMVMSDPVMVMPDSEMVMSDPVMVMPDSEMVMSEPVMVMPHSEMIMAEPMMVTPDPEMVMPEPVMLIPDPEMVMSEPVMLIPDPEMVMSEPVMLIPDPEMVMSEPVMLIPDPEMVMPEPVMVMPDPEMVMPDPETVMSEPVMVMPDPEMVISEPKVESDVQKEIGEEIPCTVDEETIKEAEDVSTSVQIADCLVQQLCAEISDPPHNSVPESFQLQENKEEQVGVLELVEDTMAHPEPEVETFFQPEEGSDKDVFASDPVPEDSAASPMDSGISSAEKELDSQSSHVETEPSVDSSSDCTKPASYSQDVEYDPFYRDTKTEDSSNSDVAAEVDCEASAAPADVQTKDVPSSCIDNPDPLSVAGGIGDLVPGSEVQVTLDHIIQDALVVSFRHGDRIFSGVLMDLSKRFGPHGIPVTVHPKREYKNKPEEPIQPQSTSFQEEPSSGKNENETSPVDVVSPVPSTEPCGVNNNNNLWTSKPPPLFHEGAPYPPPLFIRDTYNQSIPQPPPRKIKRLKKKIYREEPTSIMNAIKLRPRQVLCDKCKNVVADKREVRKTTGSDSFKLEEGKRRRHESVTTVNKKLKTDHKVNGKSQSEGPKKNPVSKVSNLAHGRGKVVKVASQTNAPKAQLHTKKVLQSKNMDHAKAREVLKMAKEKAQKKQKDATSSKNAHGKVHFTRRLQNTTSGTLPPRLRIKPQRYRNEENDSSLKIGLESLRSSKIGIKPQTRYTATRSAGEAPSEIKTPSNGPEEVSSAIENTSVCVPPGEQNEQQALSKRGSKSNITVYMTLNQKKADSSSASVCSSDSTDDLKSTHSECSSTENFDFPPGSMHAPSSSSSSSSKEEKKLSNSLKIKVFSKNVSKCVTPDGRTICVGDIVWAKIYGFPWWPARILTITVSRKDNGLLVRQEASIAWFGSPTTSFLALSQLSPFLENFQSRFNKKRKGLYRKAITEAAKAAKQLTPEVRALLTQFET